ncbi:hypothetical protein DM02DRAFT_600866 [Periconia macrospinosa]|uniref:Protein kinase domain-containing protein n=1 Tax=Periconia macrospinosa TaxID=97972 RepID=A0A2V1DBK6_9PLEO|nr:hypothetical protein DM02DRAFT_600866 [Periconia macrospinosa]
MIEDAFQRHPRPQLPTKAALLLGTLKSPNKADRLTPNSENQTREIIKEDPWQRSKRLGELIQGERRWTIGMRRSTIVMLQSKKDVNTCKQLLDRVKPLSHANIACVLNAYESNDQIHLMFEYSRYTLEEILCVHMPLEEVHIRAIVQSHIANAADFDHCLLQTTDLCPNIDLRLLGYTILECMEGSTNKQLRNQEYVQEQRNMNKIFGIKDCDKWSGSKLLVDFLDDLFNQKKPAIAKLDKEHAYIRQQRPAPTVLLPFTELVSLECFTHWRPGAKQSVNSVQ